MFFKKMLSIGSSEQRYFVFSFGPISLKETHLLRFVYKTFACVGFVFTQIGLVLFNEAWLGKYSFRLKHIVYKTVFHQVFKCIYIFLCGPPIVGSHLSDPHV